MSDTHADPPAGGGTGLTRNKGQLLIAEYRRARIAARPALRTELRACRAELQQQRLGRLAAGAAQAASSPQDIAPPGSGVPSPAVTASSSGDAAASIFATYCVAMAAPAPAEAPRADAVPEPAPAPEAETAPEAATVLAAETVPEADTAKGPAAWQEPPPAAAETPARPQIPLPETVQAAEPEPRPAVPLSAIGFGPGMTIRLGQLGIESAGELAAADAAWLQTALGGLSDLVHAESWIAAARQACGHPA